MIASIAAMNNVETTVSYTHLDVYKRQLQGLRLVTNSSAAVGCMPMVVSKRALVAPARMAMAMPCMIDVYKRQVVA